MFRYLFFLLLTTACCSFLQTDQFLGLHRQKRLSGGTPHANGAYPFSVSLWYMGMNSPNRQKSPGLFHYCGGALIDVDVVLTAAHCLDGDPVGTNDTSLWEVYVGMHEQLNAQTEAQKHGIAKIVISPSYKTLFQTLYNDVALVILDRPVQLNAAVQLVKLNSDPNCPIQGQNATVAGWGQTSKNVYRSNFPNHITVGTLTSAECTTMFNTYLKKAINKTLPAGFLEGKLCAGQSNGCSGDSGSPLVTQCGNDNSYSVVGVLSVSAACGLKDLATIYTRISSFFTWIHQTMCLN